MLQLIRELIFKFAIPDTRPASAIAERVARLDHELGYYSMEEHPIVVSTPCMPDEVFHRLGSLLWEEAQVHVSQRRMDRSGGREHGCTRRCSGWRGGGDRLLFPSRTLVEDISVTGFRTAISVIPRGASGSKPTRKNKQMMNVNVLRLTTREHIKALSFEASAE